ncbi:MAG: 7-carboxy-7-deazaguanine synthase QueE [Planctomycetaceae bacterium]|nr:7-carboxy-7-deazaguanine synthase QueE [Planctomycetaceae bacterium]
MGSLSPERIWTSGVLERLQAERVVLISEVFESIQGEGPWAGTESLFIRTSGCNLRCWFCDTPYTSWQPEGTQVSLADLAQTVARSSAPDVVLTGGEPMLVSDLADLTALCQQQGRRITIETAGTVYQHLSCHLMAISPKLKNSVPMDAVWGPRHERTRHQPQIIRQLLQEYSCILKFVIDKPGDLEEVHACLSEFPQVQPEIVWLMPQARTREQLQEKAGWIRDAAAVHGFQFSSRLHIEKFGNRRGT